MEANRADGANACVQVKQGRVEGVVSPLFGGVQFFEIHQFGLVPPLQFGLRFQGRKELRLGLPPLFGPPLHGRYDSLAKSVANQMFLRLMIWLLVPSFSDGVFDTWCPLKMHRQH